MLEKLLIPISIVIAGLIVAGSILVSSGNFSFSLPTLLTAKPATIKSTSTPPTTVPSPAAPIVRGDDLGTNEPVGNKNAPVKIVEFGDYQCPYCEKFFKTVEPQIKKELINTNKAVFAFRDLAFLGPESKDAALAARCAGDQRKYWQYHDKLFLNQRGENLGAFKVENLKKFARDLGLNQNVFNQCFTNRRHDGEIQADSKAAGLLGVRGTPTLFINGQIFPNWSDFQGIKTLVESQTSR